ncbi:Phospholipase ABHD3, partial [Eschrichtius robustus]|nr:Phospholipase ABHD3 [Eschrichtius robustus]
MQRLAMDLRMLSRELSLYLEHQVRISLFGSGVGLSLILGFSFAYACYYMSSIAKFIDTIELIKTADGGQISLDWFDDDNSKCYMDASTRPTILLLPGLTGTSKESYILHMIHLSEELGYRKMHN